MRMTLRTLASTTTVLKGGEDRLIGLAEAQSSSSSALPSLVSEVVGAK